MKKCIYIGLMLASMVCITSAIALDEPEQAVTQALGNDTSTTDTVSPQNTLTASEDADLKKAAVVEKKQSDSSTDSTDSQRQEDEDKNLETTTEDVTESIIDNIS